MADKPKASVTDITSRLRDAPPARRMPSVLPEDCPVTPLGVEGSRCHFLDALGQLVTLTPQQLGRRWLATLFTPFVTYLTKHWPRVNDKGVVTGLRPEAVADDLTEACGHLGVWSPYAKVRGRGAWRGEDDDLILHLGDKLWIKGHVVRPGVRNGLVYPVQPARPHPHPQAQPGGEEGPAHHLHAMLRTWCWSRPDLDDRLLLGWVCAALLGGALHWRPACWVTGDRGTGKSTLQELVRHLMVDGEGIYSVGDTTAAGIRSAVGYDSLPVALDELEAEEDNTRVNAVITLARHAASGATILRGSSDHSGANFIARFATLYSSILVPPLRSQDRSRIALLMLRPLGGRKPPLLQPTALRELGQRLLRRMADRWHALPAALDTWRQALISTGYDARGADQFGTLLACADVALHDDPIDGDSLGEIVARLVASTADERADEMADWARCLEHLVTSAGPMKSDRVPLTIGTLAAMAAGRRMLRDPETQREDVRPTYKQQAEAADLLASVGLRVMPEVPPGLDRPAMPESLAVANAHKGLNTVFVGSHWQGRSGASGTWRQALLRCPGAVGSPTSVNFRGTKQRAVLVPLARCLGEYDAATAREAPAE